MEEGSTILNPFPQAEDIISLALKRGVRLATAESCTGGMVAAALTEIAGASSVVECGFVTYSNKSKVNMLGVDDDLISKEGAVSKEVACAMSRGAILQSDAELSVAITGIAGPSGGSDEKPVGLVYIASSWHDNSKSEKNKEVCLQYRFEGGRAQVRQQSVVAALQLLHKQMVL